MFKSMPRELLLVLRNQNYIRALNFEYRYAVNRFRIMAEVRVCMGPENGSLLLTFVR